ncbi:MAG: phage portal protein [Rhizobiales bacterium]|nr:phage portal protein [Hyphomicrobiales bacterium]
MGVVSWSVARVVGAAYRVYASASDEVAKQRRLRLTDGDAWNMAFGHESAAGKSVTLNTAMTLAAFSACVRVTAQAVAALPISVFVKDNDGGRSSTKDHPLADLLEISPNYDQTSLEYWETVVAWLLVQGNACSEISRGAAGRIVALDVLPGCHPFRKPDGDLVYRYNDRGKRYELPREKVFHVKGFGFDRDEGVSVIRNGVQTFGTALASIETAGKLFSNGMQASGILTSDKTLKKDQRDGLQEIMDKYTGSEKAGKLMILEAGLKYQGVTLNPVDAQLLEQQRFSVEEICRWFGVPPVIVGHAAQGQTMWGSGVEQILVAWLALGINPLCERIERRILKQLVAPAEQRRVYAEFNREGLLQMDSAAKAAFLSAMVQNGLMDRNEGRSKLNMPARAGADQLTAQTNLAPLDKLGTTADGQQARNAIRNWLGIVDAPANDRKAEAA